VGLEVPRRSVLAAPRATVAQVNARRVVHDAFHIALVPLSLLVVLGFINGRAREFVEANNG
jgi:hypothetical protein